MQPINTMARQGDVMLRRVDKMPDAVKPVERDNGRVVLAYGEVTGHSHALASPRVAMFMDTGGAGGRYIRVQPGEAVALEHEEHSTILIEPGDYQVIQQTEYTPEAVRNVAD